jgi:hypothetical protein
LTFFTKTHLHGYEGDPSKGEPTEIALCLPTATDAARSFQGRHGHAERYILLPEVLNLDAIVFPEPNDKSVITATIVTHTHPPFH